MKNLHPAQASLIVSVSAIGFVSLWLERISGNTFDQTLIVSSTGLLTHTALLISALTSPTTVLAVVVIGGLFATYEHHTKMWWLLSGVLFFSTAASMILKQLLVLPRPDTALIQLTSYGFPSTHATLATVLFIVGVWLYTWLDGEKSTLLTLVAGLLWLAICGSRLILGVHSVSDILAGIMLGVAIGSIAVSLAPHVFKYFRIRRSSFRK